MSTTLAISRSNKAKSTHKVQSARKRSAKGSPPIPMPTLLIDAKPAADVVTIPSRNVLAIEGRGAPEQEAFQDAIGALYGVAYTLKLARKVARGNEFKIGPLEARWWSGSSQTSLARTPRDNWCWRLRIAVPVDVTAAEVADVVRTATTRRGGKLEDSTTAKRVALERIPAQRVGRALHVGPYAQEGRTIAPIDAAIAEAGYAPAGAHVEIYLNDPRRTPSARLKTVLLREAARASA